MNISSEIPGVGEYPDLVTLEEPSFIEVKRYKITERRKEQIKEQLIRYCQPEVIKSTIKQLKYFSKEEWKEPEKLILVSPEGGKEKELISEIQEITDFESEFLVLKRLYMNCINRF
ncbi:MAG: hypothetical protein ACTSP3_00090 [Candidatus Heimdallarchaeaceae archaeon]